MSFLISIFKPLAYVSLPVILVRQIAVSRGFGRYYARIVVYVGTLMAVASCSVIIAAGMSLIGRATDVNYMVARIFYALTSKALDLHIEVEGEEHLRTCPSVLMVNHQSMIDVLIIGKLMPKQTAIMAKKSLQYTPLGPFMTLSGTIFIDRGNSAHAFRSIDAAGEKMKRTKTSLWMFPEGTRHLSKEATMLPLKKGGFHLAINAGIPVTPIVSENYWHIYRKGVFESGTFKVRVLPPVPTTGLTIADVGSLSTRVREQMLVTLREISTHAAVPSGKDEPKTDLKEQTINSLPSKPTETASLFSPPGGTVPVSVEPVLQANESSSSIASSAMSSVGLKIPSSSENGETEEDEGMILVGRPR